MTPLQAPDLRDAFVAAQALALASARVFGIAAFLPLLGKRLLGRLATNAVCIAVSLPQAFLLWQPLHDQIQAPWACTVVGLKEAMIGCGLGLALSTPYWALRGALTMADNQRGANAAEILDPTHEPDASLLGELVERGFIACLAAAGLFVLVFDVIADSYAAVPILSGWQGRAVAAQAQAVGLFQQSLLDALAYGAPPLLIVLLVDVGLACISAVIEGVQVYAMAPAVKALLATLVVALYIGTLLHWAADDFEQEARSHAVLRILAPH